MAYSLVIKSFTNFKNDVKLISHLAFIFKDYKFSIKEKWFNDFFSHCFQNILSLTHIKISLNITLFI